MAMPAEEPPNPTAIEEHPRLQLLRAFFLEYYRVSQNPAARLDGDQVARAFAVYSDQPNDEPQPRHRFYQDVRSLGFVVQPATNNRQAIYGIEPLPHAAAALTDLTLRWPDLAQSRQDQSATSRAVRSASQAVANSLTLTAQVIEEAVDTTVEIMRTSLDEGRRLMAANMLMSRGIPQLKAREIDPQAIEVQANEARPSIAEIAEVLLVRESRQVPEPAATDTQSVAT